MSLPLLSRTPPTALTISNTVSKTLRATASDIGGVEKVVFYVNGEKVGEDNSVPYEVGWETHAPGEYFAYAVALNSKGYDNGSAPVIINVVADNCDATPQAVIPQFPEDGGIIHNSRTPILRWSWAGNLNNVPTGYELFIGETSQNMEKAATLDSYGDSSYAISSPLEMGKSFYWRVDAVNNCGTTTGEISSFDLVSPAGFRYLRIRLYKDGGLGHRIYSAQWHENGEGLVPQLSSNSEQSVELSATRNYEKAYHVYDADESSEWGTNEEASNTIDFGTTADVNPDRITLHLSGGSRAPDSLRFEGSYFGDDWYSIGKLTSFPEDNVTVELHEPRLIAPPTGTSRNRKTITTNPPRILAVGGRITLEIPRMAGIAKHTVRIYDAFGRTVFARTLQKDCRIATNMLPKGVYLVRVVDVGGVAEQKRVCLYR